jgi:predicted secreted protein
MVPYLAQYPTPKSKMLEMIRKDFGISKEEFDSMQKMVKKETMEATVRFATYATQLLTKFKETQESGGDVNEYV